MAELNLGIHPNNGIYSLAFYQHKPVRVGLSGFVNGKFNHVEVFGFTDNKYGVIFPPSNPANMPEQYYPLPGNVRTRELTDLLQQKFGDALIEYHN